MPQATPQLMLYPDGTTIQVGDHVFYSNPHFCRGIRVRCYVFAIRFERVLVVFPVHPEDAEYGTRGRWISPEFLTPYVPYGTRSQTRRMAGDQRVMTRQRARTGDGAVVHHTGWRE